MSQTTAPKVVPLVEPSKHPSRHWLPEAVAHRLMRRLAPGAAGWRVLAQRDRQLTGGRTRHRSWVYWDVVLIVIERRTSLRFRERTPRPRAGSAA